MCYDAIRSEAVRTAVHCDDECLSTLEYLRNLVSTDVWGRLVAFCKGPDRGGVRNTDSVLLRNEHPIPIFLSARSASHTLYPGRN